MKKIKTIMIILAILLVSLVSFGGIYVQKQNRMENKVKEYDLGMDLSGARTIRLTPDTGTDEIVKDADGKVVENPTDEDKQKEGYTTEEVKKNEEEVLTTENYKKSKEVVEKRLKLLGVKDYLIRLDEENGDIIVEIPEDTNTDSILSNVYPQGKFQMLDEKDNTVLMNNSDIKTATVQYNTTTSGTVFYLIIQFNKEGTKKYKDITSTYTTEKVQTTNEDGTTEEKEEDKNIVMKLDDEKIISTNFDETNENGIIQLSLNKATTDQEQLQQYLKSGQSIAVLLETGNTPVEYKVEENEYIQSDITKNMQQITVISIIVIIAIALIVLIIRYKFKGLLSAISYIGFLAIYLLIIRYANVTLTIEGILGILISIILNSIWINIILNKIKKGTSAKLAVAQTFKDTQKIVIPAFILFTVSAFISWSELNSFGMTIFWGYIIQPIYNVIVTRGLLILNEKENNN